MCVQCVMGAMSVTAGASGTRAWLATRQWACLTPRVLRRITLGLLAVVLIASTILVGGSTPIDRTGSGDRAATASSPLPVSETRRVADLEAVG